MKRLRLADGFEPFAVLRILRCGSASNIFYSSTSTRSSGFTAGPFMTLPTGAKAGAVTRGQAQTLFWSSPRDVWPCAYPDAADCVKRAILIR